MTPRDDRAGEGEGEGGMSSSIPLPAVFCVGYRFSRFYLFAFAALRLPARRVSDISLSLSLSLSGGGRGRQLVWPAVFAACHEERLFAV